MRIAMIGTGYVGLVSGACLSEFGHHVICVDKDGGKIADLERRAHSDFEPGLEEMVAANVKARRLSFRRCCARRRDAEAVFIAVGTPSRRGDGHADLTYVFEAAREIAPRSGAMGSSSPNRRCRSARAQGGARSSARRAPDAEFDVVSNPEFLREGSAIEDFMRPDRIVIGIDSDARARRACAKSSAALSQSRRRSCSPSRETAELIKYAANAFLATKITFINEIADLCERLGADVQDVARGIGLDGRIGPKFLHAGPGYRRVLFPQGHAGAGADCAGSGRADRASSKRSSAVNEQRKKRDGGQDHRGLRRLAGKNDRRARPDLQAQHRRHAQRAEPRHRPDAAGAGATIAPMIPKARRRPRKFSTSRSSPMPRGDRRRRRRSHPHRMERVPRAGTRPREGVLKRPLMVDLRNIYRPKQMPEAGFTDVNVGRPSDPETRASTEPGRNKITVPRIGCVALGFAVKSAVTR